jgi:potassium-transporting ATPase KdpC subunit
MKAQTILAIKFLLGMIILTGIIYPFFMTGFAQIVFPIKANGSLYIKDGKTVGSALIGQKFDSSIYFSSRPSAIDYNPVPSSGSNLGPTSDRLKTQMTERCKAFATINSIMDTTAIPKEMIFASASGLDPHISVEAALLQLDRVATSRNFSEDQKLRVRQLIKSKTEGPQFSLFGELRINVFELNLALDNIK